MIIVNIIIVAISVMILVIITVVIIIVNLIVIRGRERVFGSSADSAQKLPSAEHSAGKQKDHA